MILGIVGLGFVGGAVRDSFSKRDHTVHMYDKYKEFGSLESMLDTDIVFLCLPTPYIEGHGYNIYEIQNTCEYLARHGYNGLVVLKSTVEPGTTKMLSETYGLDICHNPEFLTARTASEDFENQNHIVLGNYIRSSRRGEFTSSSDIIITKEKFSRIVELYESYWPGAKITVCSSDESELMKMFANSFYAVKVQAFNELFLLSQKIGANFESIRMAILNNGWVNEMHTKVPGPDGNISFSGACFPKDISAMTHFMKTKGSPHQVIDAARKERNEMRKE